MWKTACRLCITVLPCTRSSTTAANTIRIRSISGLPALFAVDPAVYCDQSRFDMVPDAIKDATLAPNPSFMLLYEDPLTLVFEKDLEGVPLAAHYTDVAEEFAALAAKTTGELKPVAEHYARLAAVLRDKCTWREKAPGIVRSGDRAAAVEMAALADKLIGSSGRLPIAGTTSG